MSSPTGRVGWVGQDPAEWTSASGVHVMATDDDKPDAGRAGGQARSKPRSNDRPFDMWLHKQLHAMYDEIASEPLPDDLLNLIDKDAAANKKGDSPEEPPKK
jgi:hypothetical protein